MNSLERSVDSLQQIYAVIIALAIGQAIQLTFLSGPDGFFSLSASVLDSLPVFIAFVATIVPFYHGMNRHLDRCYVERQNPHLQGALLFDFVVFFFEAALLFGVATLIKSSLDSFVLLGMLLVVDTLWALISHWIHYRELKPSVLRWATINAITVFIIWLIVLANEDTYSEENRSWVLMLIAVARSIIDYWVSWNFYFPQASADNFR